MQITPKHRSVLEIILLWNTVTLMLGDTLGTFYDVLPPKRTQFCTNQDSQRPEGAHASGQPQMWAWVSLHPVPPRKCLQESGDDFACEDSTCSMPLVPFSRFCSCASSPEIRSDFLQKESTNCRNKWAGQLPDALQHPYLTRQLYCIRRSRCRWLEWERYIALQICGGGICDEWHESSQLCLSPCHGMAFFLEERCEQYSLTGWLVLLEQDRVWFASGWAQQKAHMWFWHAEDPSAQLLSVQTLMDPIGFPMQTHGGHGETVDVQRQCLRLVMPVGLVAF